MSIFNIFNISGSALNAQSIRFNTIASNLANANTISSNTKDIYKARHPVFKTELQKGFNKKVGSGVYVDKVITSNAPPVREYNPNHPLANAQGYVFRPNVNIMEEMADMISTTRNYQTNVEITNSAKNLLNKILELGKS